MRKWDPPLSPVSCFPRPGHRSVARRWSRAPPSRTCEPPTAREAGERSWTGRRRKKPAPCHRKLLPWRQPCEMREHRERMRRQQNQKVQLRQDRAIEKVRKRAHAERTRGEMEGVEASTSKDGNERAGEMGPSEGRGVQRSGRVADGAYWEAYSGRVTKGGGWRHGGWRRWREREWGSGCGGGWRRAQRAPKGRFRGGLWCEAGDCYARVSLHSVFSIHYSTVSSSSMSPVAPSRASGPACWR